MTQNNQTKNNQSNLSKTGSITENRYLTMIRTAFGPEILKFMEDDQVIEIMLNPDGKLWIRKTHRKTHVHWNPNFPRAI